MSNLTDRDIAIIIADRNRQAKVDDLARQVERACVSLADSDAAALRRLLGCGDVACAIAACLVRISDETDRLAAYAFAEAACAVADNQRASLGAVVFERVRGSWGACGTAMRISLGDLQRDIPSF